MVDANTEPFLAEHVHDVLARDERVSAPELTVTVEHGHVHVDGVIATGERKEAIAIVIRESWPELVLDDRTIVADFPPDGAIEVL